MKKKFLIGVFSSIVVIMTIITLLTTSSRGEWALGKDPRGFNWYYELVDGEAVNVRANSPSLPCYEHLEIPATLNGYPVTSIAGTHGGWSGPAYYGGENIFGLNDAWHYVGENESIVAATKEIVLPEGLKRIEYNTFMDCHNLETISIPSTLEYIGPGAFSGTNIKSLELDNVEVDSAFGSKLENLKLINKEVVNSDYGSVGLKNITIGEGVRVIKSFGTAKKDAIVRVSSDIEQITDTAFFGVTDVWVDKEEEDVEIVKNPREGLQRSYFHFNNKEKIETDLIDGIKVINADNNEEVTTTKVTTGSNFTFKLALEEGKTVDDYVVFIESVGEYQSDDTIVEQIQLPIGETYTIENITRNKKIHVKARKDGQDLVLRQYISEINYQKVSNSREPVVEKQADGKVNYLHTKDLVYTRVGDRVKYGIRVYNEGTVDGKANKITEYIPEGLTFDPHSEINTQYGWDISEDGRVATTEYLSTKNIEEYTIKEVSYEDIFIDLIVDVEPTNDFVRLVTMAEITEQNGIDTDSNPGNITRTQDGIVKIGKTEETDEEITVDETYLKEESENSNNKSYIKGREDDNDFESVTTSNNIPLPYSLVIKKIDGIDNKLLNGATFDLLDEDKNVIRTGVTANGGVLDFGTVYTYGDKKSTYYVRETYTPEGYKNHLKYLVQVDIINDIENAQVKPRFELDIRDIDVDTSKYETIEISTKEELRAIQNNQDKKYVLTQDIDLAGENWSPLSVSNVKLDGQNHKIANLKIEATDETENAWGLFRTYSGIIENLTLEDVDIDLTKFNPDADAGTIDGVGAFIGLSDGVVIKNCKVTGTIDSTLRNIGGFVGHTNPNSILVTRNCVNEANITATTSHNVGGIVGCAKGPVKSYSDENKGTITTASYSAGGIIGHSDPQGYELTQVFANYDEDTKVVTMAIKNEAISGEYQIKLVKTDEKNNLLDGAKFQLLDRNKQVIPGYEEIVARNGVVSLDKTRIDCIGNDVYYLKETEAPRWHQQLTDTIIKIVIEKKWNKETSTYYTEVRHEELTESEFENATSEPYNTSETKSGLTYEKIVNDSIKWNIAETDVNDSINNGTITNAGITSTYIEYGRTKERIYNAAGGLVGETKGRTLISGAKNQKEVTATAGDYVQVGGIIALNEGKEDSNNMIVDRCENNAEITGIANGGVVSGIVGRSRINIEMNNCVNNGSVTGTGVTAAGILGDEMENVLLKDCTNKGNIKTMGNSDMIMTGGIFAKNLWFNYEKEYPLGSTTIIGCSNEGNLEGANHVAGILTTTVTPNLKIENCSSKNCDIKCISSAHAGGIAGYITSENVDISNSNIENVNLNTGKKGAGILAEHSQNGGTRNINASEMRLNINNCKIISSKIEGPLEIAGILANGGYYTEETKIFNCDVIDSQIINNSTGSGNPANCVGGIMATEYHNKKIEIDNCNIDSSTILGCGKVAGIYAGGTYTEGLDITNCKVVNHTHIENINQNPDNTNTAGILGGHITWDGPVHLANLEVTDSEIIAQVGNVGGIMNMVASNTSYQTTVENCKVENTTMETQEEAVCNCNMGGISGGCNQKLNLKNCNVLNCKILDKCCKMTGGIIGITRNTTNIENCNVIDTDIQSTTVGPAEVGGLVGMSIGGVINISDCTVKGTTEKMKIEGKGQCLGGTIGYANYTSSKVKDTTVENVDITYNKTIPIDGTVGGISAMNTAVENCTFKNSNITTNAHNTGGLVGSVRGDAFVSNCGISGRVEAEAYCGSMFGTTKKLIIAHSEIETNVSGKDIIGGISGIVDSVSLTNNIIHASVFPQKSAGAQGLIVGYNSEEQESKIRDMLLETLPLLRDSQTLEEKELIRSLTNNGKCNY